MKHMVEFNYPLEIFFFFLLSKKLYLNFVLRINESVKKRKNIIEWYLSTE